MKSIRVQKIYEQVADRIVEMIKTGGLKPGDRLDSVEQLAKSFGVSRSAVREAISGLRAMGIVDVRQGEGTFVGDARAASFTLSAAGTLIQKREDIRELSELRRILEVGAAGVSALNRSEEDLRSMEVALREMETALGTGEVGEKADLAFHMALFKGTRNRMLIDLLSNVTDITLESMRETRRLILYSEERLVCLLEEHRKIYEAIEKQDSVAAEKAMADHLAAVDHVLSPYLR